jgi:dihydrofolate reductase
VALYAAVAENGVIGRDGGLPWRLSSDLKRFKADTLGKPIVMGRKTWASLPRRPLPGRLNIVVSRDPDFSAIDASVARSASEALKIAEDGRGAPDGEIAVIGGADLFAAVMPLADKLNITHVLAEIDGDVFFPKIDPAVWEIVSSEDFPAGENDSYPTRYVIYRRH